MSITEKQKKKLIYIVSSRYSGTTLLSAILGAHPDISTIGERKKFYIKSLRPGGEGRFDCSCGKLYSECEYWTAIRDKVLAEVPADYLNTDVTQFAFYNNRFMNRLAQKTTQHLIANNHSVRFTPFASRVKELCRVNELIIKASLKLDGNEIFVDSSKPIRHALYLSLIQDFDFYVIYLVRDPRAQSASAMKRHGWSAEQAAQTWLEDHQYMRKVFNTWKVRKIELTYGSFCREPEKHLRALLNFAGIDSSRSSLDFKDAPRHFSGNKPMLKAKTNEIKERKEWMEKLSAKEINVIEQLTMDFWASESQNIESRANIPISG